MVAGLAPNTKKCASSLIRSQLLPALSACESPAEMVDFWEARGLKPGTICKLLSHYVTYCRVTGQVPADISRLKRSVARRIERSKKAWTREQAQRALGLAFHLSRRELYLPMLMTLHTGVRLGEMQNITWQDINFTQQTICIPVTKSGRPRTVPMSEALLAQLRAIRGVGRVFPPADYTGRLKRFCRAAQLPVLSWHELRHTFATVLLDHGESLRRVADILGHSNISTTVNTYWHRPQTNLEIQKDLLP